VALSPKCKGKAIFQYSEKKWKSFLQNNIKKPVFTKHFDISTLQTAVGSRQSRSLGFRKISRHIYMVWFFFYNFAAK